MVQGEVSGGDACGGETDPAGSTESQDPQPEGEEECRDGTGDWRVEHYRRLGTLATSGAGSGAMITPTHFAFRIDRWDQHGDNLLDHVAGIQDFQVSQATFEAACKRWPGETITLRQGARIIEDSRKIGFA